MEIQEEQQRVRAKMSAYQAASPTATQSLDLLALTSKAADLFLLQPASEKRKLLRLVVDEASWGQGELRMSFQEPFEQMRLSNFASLRNHLPLTGNNAILDNWR